MELSPAQCRAARALVEVSRERLAQEARVAIRTIADFEAGRRKPIHATMEAIQRALESAGVDFIAENGGGAGVRLRKVKE
jgi:predicted transcriptional regulator